MTGAIEGNYVGTDASGENALGNAWGISVSPGDQSGITIGGTAPGDGNVVSGNSRGIQLTGSDNLTVEGNYIGTDATGTAALGNSYFDVAIYQQGNATGNVIGGAASGSRNVIPGSTLGVDLVGPGVSGNTIEGNYIGTNAAGTAALANTTGVELNGVSSNTLSGNLISGNTGDGVSVTGNAPATTSDLPGGLAAWYQADGNTNDSSGNNNNGAWVGAPGYNSVNAARAVYGQSFSPSGASGNYVAVPDGASLDLTHQVTISAWISMNAAPAVGNDYVVLSKGPTPTTENYSLYVTNVGGGDLELAVQTNNASLARYVSSGANLIASQGVFYDLAASLDGSTVKFYVDGRLVSQTAQTAALAANTGPLEIGGDALATNNTFNGYIDDVQIYNQALTAAQLLTILKGDGVAGNTISGNLIGTDASGENALGNAGQGVDIVASVSNTVGGTTAAARNVISANAKDGVFAGMFVTGQSQDAGNASGNVVDGNYIGADAAGAHALGNGAYGVAVGGNGALDELIGGVRGAGGNLISGNLADGITGQGIFSGNLIGTDATGTSALPNHGNGISAGGIGITIGGSAPGDGNVVSGNQNDGIWIVNSVGVVIQGNCIGADITGEHALPNAELGILLDGASYTVIGVDGSVVPGGNNVVAGNYIGADASGTAALPNGTNVGYDPNDHFGLYVLSSNNRIGVAGNGVDDAGERNIISGNASVGVYITGLDNIVAGNYIGTDVTGTHALANGAEGVYLGSSYANSDNRVGVNSADADPAGERNVISGNSGDGVDAGGPGTQPSGDVVAGNYIGVDATGAAALANSGVGVNVSASSDTLGGTASVDRNIISGNTGDGVKIAGAGVTQNLVEGNYIGTNAAGTAALGNASNGVDIGGSANNIVGGTTAGAGNVISGNSNNAVLLDIGTTGSTVAGN